MNKWLGGARLGRRYALCLAEIFDAEPDYFVSTRSDRVRSDGGETASCSLAWG